MIRVFHCRSPSRPILTDFRAAVSCSSAARRGLACLAPALGPWHNTAMAGEIEVFDRRAVRRHRERAAADFAAHDFLFREAGERLGDRLSDVRRSFPLALDLGCHDGLLAHVLAGRGGVENWISADLALGLALRASGFRVVADAEFLPFAPASLDLVASVLSLHWVNDLPGALLQIQRALKPDGLFLASLFGPDTLADLRRAWLEAEAEYEGGASPHVSPFITVADAGRLMQRAGFALPVVDRDWIEVSYGEALKLMRDLRGMGESNALIGRRKGFARRATFARVLERFAQLSRGDDGRLTVRFEIVTLTGWRPHPAQQQPLRPGSAETRLADALGVAEHPAGDKADP